MKKVNSFLSYCVSIKDVPKAYIKDKGKFIVPLIAVKEKNHSISCVLFCNVFTFSVIDLSNCILCVEIFLLLLLLRAAVMMSTYTQTPAMRHFYECHKNNATQRKQLKIIKKQSVKQEGRP
uniref:Uncharacterized protein n=1 Tax=Glossina brevipalpis TaxID=37001 RepID=A0A1A9W0M4_9MUSC